MGPAIVDTSPLVNKALDLLVDTVCIVDEKGLYVFVSAACERLLGYTQEELIGKNMIEFVHPEDRERTLKAAANVMAGKPHAHFENRYVRKDGRIVDIMWSARWSQTDRVRLAVARDVTPLKHAERMQRALYRISEAAHAAEGLSGLYQHIHRVIEELLPAQNFSVVLYDKSSETVTYPYPGDEDNAEPQPWPLDPETPVAQVIHHGAALLTTRQEAGEMASSEHTHWLGAPLISHSGVVGALVVHGPAGGLGYTEQDKDLLQFVSTQVAAAIERKQTEARLHHMARYDAPTDLPNRALFHDRLDTAMKHARHDGQYLALLYLDIDDFKEINDTFGHDAGDRILREVAERLTACVRQSDTVGRMGGDEFTILLTNIRGPDSVGAITQKLHDALALPFHVDKHVITLSASFGSAIYPGQGRDRDELFRSADAGMYTDKRKR